MDAKTGEIYRFTADQADQLLAEDRRRLIPLSEQDARTLEPMSMGRRKNWMRNKPCICGSNSKFKNCCWSKYA